MRKAYQSTAGLIREFPYESPFVAFDDWFRTISQLDGSDKESNRATLATATKLVPPFSSDVRTANLKIQEKVLNISAIFSVAKKMPHTHISSIYFTDKVVKNMLMS